MNQVLFGFLKKELTQMLRNPVMVFALLFMPIVQSFLFSYAITNEPKNISIAIDAEPKDYMMNKILNRALASKWFVVAKPSVGDSFYAVQNGIADVVIIAPSDGLTHSFLRDNGELQVLINASNVIKAQSVSGYINAIVTEVILNEMCKNITAKNPVNLHFCNRILFNPEMDTKIFIVPAIMVMIIMSTVLSLVCIAITKEKEVGTIETLISAPIKKHHIMLGKILPYIGIACFNMICILLIGMLIFHVPFRGSIAQFSIAFAIFCFSISMLAVFLSTLCKTQQQAMLLIMMVLFLAMMLSGSMFPVENMPDILKFFANINPLTHYTFLVRNIMLKGGSLNYFTEHITPMIIFGVVATIAGIKKFKQTL